jgi:transposase-like protein
MPLREISKMDARLEFVTLASHPQANVRELCRRFTISPDTGYRLLNRFAKDGAVGLGDRSRRPLHFPRQTAAEMEQMVLDLRNRQPSWGGRKIRHLLKTRVKDRPIPAASTITGILKRHQKIDPHASPGPFTRFEREAPNDLWQMDFKGPMASDQGIAIR